MHIQHKQPQKPYIPILFVFLAFSSHYIWAATDQSESIQRPIKELHNNLIHLMKDSDNKNFQDRYAFLEPTIIKHFNSPLIAKVVLSRYWKTLDKLSQESFIALFNRLTISTYIDRFDSFNDESFTEPSIEKMKKNRYLVKTKYIRKDDDPVSFNYIVQNDNEEWKIISVIANGINDLSLKRADYCAVIKEQGFDALLVNLEEKISDLEAGN